MQPIEAERRYSARNYDPLPVVLARGQGAPIRQPVTVTPIRAFSTP
jgi:hypothetical protein